MFVRRLYLVAGIVCVALGFVGLVLPVMPGFVFFILALAAFRRSSPAFEGWLLERSPVAPALREWDETRALRPRTKRRILVLLWAAIGLSCIYLVRKRAAEWREFVAGGGFHPLLLIPLGLLVIGTAVSAYIVTRKTIPNRELEPPRLT